MTHASPHGFQRATMVRTRDAVARQALTNPNRSVDRPAELRREIRRIRDAQGQRHDTRSIIAVGVTVPAIATVIYAVQRLADVLFVAPW